MTDGYGKSAARAGALGLVDVFPELPKLDGSEVTTSEARSNCRSVVPRPTN